MELRILQTELTSEGQRRGPKPLFQKLTSSKLHFLNWTEVRTRAVTPGRVERTTAGHGLVGLFCCQCAVPALCQSSLDGRRTCGQLLVRPCATSLPFLCGLCAPGDRNLHQLQRWRVLSRFPRCIPFHLLFVTFTVHIRSILRQHLPFAALVSKKRRPLCITWQLAGSALLRRFPAAAVMLSAPGGGRSCCVVGPGRLVQRARWNKPPPRAAAPAPLGARCARVSSAHRPTTTRSGAGCP